MKRIVVILAVILGLAGAGVGVLLLTQASGPEVSAKSTSDTDDGSEALAAQEPPESSDDEDRDGPAAIPVNVVRAARGDVSTYITATANLVPEDEVMVLAEAEGRVTRLHVEEGDRVEEGELLAELLRDEAQILYDKAQVKFANAEMAHNRSVRMAKENLIAQEEFDRTALEHQIAQQELAEANWRLELTVIRSPFAGRITRRDITIGQHVRIGDELLKVTSFDPLIAKVYLPESDVLALDEGRDVRITLKADESVEFAGRIRMISPVVDTATGTVKVTVEAIRPPRNVRPGGFVIVDIVRETHPSTLVLPRKAVVREMKEAHVFVVNGETAERRRVDLGLEEKEVLEILSGVEPGEEIVVAGQGGLKDGSKIKVLADADQRAATDANDANKSQG